MSCYEPTGFEWKAIEPHLPNKLRGVLRIDETLAWASFCDSIS